VRGVSLVEPRAQVADRIAACTEADVTTLKAVPLGADPGPHTIAALKEIAS